MEYGCDLVVLNKTKLEKENKLGSCIFHHEFNLQACDEMFRKKHEVKTKQKTQYK